MWYSATHALASAAKDPGGAAAAAGALLWYNAMHALASAARAVATAGAAASISLAVESHAAGSAQLRFQALNNPLQKPAGVLLRSVHARSLSIEKANASVAADSSGRAWGVTTPAGGDTLRNQVFTAFQDGGQGSWCVRTARTLPRGGAREGLLGRITLHYHLPFGLQSGAPLPDGLPAEACLQHRGP